MFTSTFEYVPAQAPDNVPAWEQAFFPVNRALRGACALLSPCALSRKQLCGMFAMPLPFDGGGCGLLRCQVGIMFETEWDKEHGCCKVEGIAQYSGDICARLNLKRRNRMHGGLCR